MMYVNLNLAEESHKDKSEDELLEIYIGRIAGNNTTALSLLYKATSASVYGFALSILKNIPDAEDVLHDTYVKIYSSAHTYKKMGKPLAWILTITRNLCLMKLRDKSRTVEFPENYWNDTFSSIPTVSSEDRLVLQACMEKLSNDERQILILHAVSGFKHKEIAELLSKPLSTVLSKYSRALKKLRAQLESNPQIKGG